MGSKKQNQQKIDNLKLYKYNLCYFKDFDFSVLDNVTSTVRPGKRDKKEIYNDLIIMADTETSKIYKGQVCENYVVAWTLSAYSIKADKPLFTIWGNKPSDLVAFIYKLHKCMQGTNTIIFFHNLSYDWVFIRKFMFASWGYPSQELATKPQFPINISFKNGIMLRDSLILAQRSLEKWAKDLNVEHQKAVGKWDYEKIRTQVTVFDSDELEYIEHDTLAGVECLAATMKTLHKRHIYSVPLTATGIPREEVRKRGFEHRAKDRFLRQAADFQTYKELLNVYHGGYTHANRHQIAWVNGSINNPVIAYDFTSSYPFVLLSEKYPMERFADCADCCIDDILHDMDNTAYMFKLCMVNVRLKNDDIPMPMLQYSKCVSSLNEILDNGRILCAEYVEIYLNENDLYVFNQQYIYDKHLCCEVKMATKSYLPRWFTDYVFELFKDKTTEKNGDPVLYALLKAKLNSLYGMTVQKSIRDEIQEDYETGEYNITSNMIEDEYQKYLDNRNSILPYQWGCWVCSYAMKNLFELGACASTWLYSDTDSCYGLGWNQKAINKYNQKAKVKLRANGYGAVMYEGKAYWLGEASLDGIYCEYVALGAKRYCGRKLNKDGTPGDLKITVAGVPKSGFRELKDNIYNFKEGLIFRGAVTGKNTHKIFINDIHEWNGNEIADSIDLSPCDYLMQSVKIVDWESIFYNEYEVTNYEFDKEYLF